MTTRPATSGDLARVVEMGARFVAESEYAALITADQAQMARTVAWLMADGAVFVAERDGALLGMIGLLPPYVHPVSGERVASELFWWVEPEARGGRTGLRLLQRAEAWARDVGASHLQMVAPNATVERIYQRLDYQRIEVGYSKRIA